MKSDKKILVAFLLNFLFSIIEFIGGLFTGSVAIISDSIHDFGDSISIGISFVLERISKKKPDNTYTYGYMRYSVLGSIITTLILIISSVIVIYNAVPRLINPVSINYDGMIIIAVFGTIINFVAALYTHGKDSLNQKAVNLHMIEDVLGWIAVLIGAVIIKITGFMRLDAILSIAVAIFILVNAFKNLKEIIDIFLEKTPCGIDLSEIKEHIQKIDGIIDAHHIHVRTIDGYVNCATLHVVTDEEPKIIKGKIKGELCEMGISHATVEIERSDENCEDIYCKPESEHHHHHHHHHH